MRRRCPSRAARAGVRCAAWLVVLAALALTPGCGLKRGPRPVSSLAPVPADFRVRQFGDDVLVSWRLPAAGQRARFDELRAHLLWIDELEPACPACPPLRTFAYEFALDDPALQVQAGAAYHLLHPSRRESGWRARAGFRFGDGDSRQTEPRTVPGLAPIPQPRVQWEWVLRPEDAPPEQTAEVRFRWQPVPERTIFVVDAGTPPSERTVYYLANVYMRAPDAEWPLVPLNEAPVDAAQWQGAPPRAALERSQGALQFALRWVDSLGGEGPLSEPVTILFMPESNR